MRSITPEGRRAVHTARLVELIRHHRATEALYGDFIVRPRQPNAAQAERLHVELKALLA